MWVWYTWVLYMWVWYTWVLYMWVWYTWVWYMWVWYTWVWYMWVWYRQLASKAVCYLSKVHSHGQRALVGESNGLRLNVKTHMRENKVLTQQAVLGTDFAGCTVTGSVRLWGRAMPA